MGQDPDGTKKTRCSRLRSSIATAVAWVTAVAWLQSLAGEILLASGVAKQTKRKKERKRKKITSDQEKASVRFKTHQLIF